MKRILLRPTGTSGIHLPTVRSAAVALARFAVGGTEGRSVGDPVHDWVTEGRRAQYEKALAAGAAWAVKMSKVGGYSSCGDLGHWMLLCLGCRDERAINRGDDGGTKPWFPGPNIFRLATSPWAIHASEYGIPDDGDILHVQRADGTGDHASVLLSKDSPDHWTTADYGQPHGRLKDCVLRDVSSGLQVRDRILVDWVSLGLVVTLGALTESAIVPDDFEGGMPDDNPYVEGLPVDWVKL